MPAEIRHEKPLWWALGLTATVLLAELAGGWLTGSLALLSDAAHMATDVLALAIALVAVRLARRPPDARSTSGYARFEALGALANGSLLFVLAGYILWEAVQRVLEPRPVASVGMLAVAVLGLACNLVAMRLLHAGAGQSLNLKGAYLEVWSDMLGSLAVILAAVLIRLTGWYWVDPLLAVLLGLWVLPRTWVLLREASAHTCRSCTLSTCGWVCRLARTASTSTPRGTPSISTLPASRSSTQVRGSTHRPISSASTGSIHCQPVQWMSSAPTITAAEPSMSLHTSR